MYISETPITVRYAETDQMGVVYHANYLVWFELGRTTLISDLGFRYHEIEAQGVVAPVLDIQVSFKKPARYGDQITVKTWVVDYDGLRITYGYEVVNQNNEVCVTGSSVHVCVNKDTFRPIIIKRSYPEWHAAYEKVKRVK